MRTRVQALHRLLRLSQRWDAPPGALFITDRFVYVVKHPASIDALELGGVALWLAAGHQLALESRGSQPLRLRVAGIELGRAQRQPVRGREVVHGLAVLKDHRPVIVVGCRLGLTRLEDLLRAMLPLLVTRRDHRPVDLGWIVGESDTHVSHELEPRPGGGTRITMTIVVRLPSLLKKWLALATGARALWERHLAEELAGIVAQIELDAPGARGSRARAPEA